MSGVIRVKRQMSCWSLLQPLEMRRVRLLSLERSVGSLQHRLSQVEAWPGKDQSTETNRNQRKDDKTIQQYTTIISKDVSLVFFAHDNRIWWTNALVTCPWHARDMSGIWIRAAMCCMPWNLLAGEILRCIAGPWEAARIARIWLVLEEFWSILKPYDPYVFFVFFTPLTLLLPKQESIVWKLICPCLCCVKMCEALICSVRRSPACVARVKNCWVSLLLNILNFGLEWLHGGRQRSAGTECHIFSVCFNISKCFKEKPCTVKFKAGTSKAAGNTPGGPRTFYESDIQKKSPWDINII